MNCTANNIDELEPRLTLHGYNGKVPAGVLKAKHARSALLRGPLAPGRAQGLQHEMLV